MEIDLEQAMELLAKARSFQVSERTFIVWRDENKWAVVCDGQVLNNMGEFEYEPYPSSRTDKFIERTRFSLQEAFDRWETFQQTNEYAKHY